MASSTAVTWARREIRRKNAGKKRKTKQAKKSTLSYKELFQEQQQVS